MTDHLESSPFRHLYGGGYQWSAPTARRWQADAACVGQPELFMQERGRCDFGPAADLCAACPVLDTCREWVLNTPHRVYGYVAGMTERERARVRRQRREAA